MHVQKFTKSTVIFNTGNESSKKASEELRGRLKRQLPNTYVHEGVRVAWLGR